MKDKKTLFSIQISEKDKMMFNAIAEYRGQTKAGVLRQWIRNAHRSTFTVPGEKK